MIRVSLFAAAFLLAVPLAGQQSPTNAEMAFIYELNRARSNPQAYDQANGLNGLLDGVAARPPLAVSENLVQSARFHSDEMATHGYFAHTSPVTLDQPNKMARDAGYPLPSAWPDNANSIESIACRYSTSGSTSYNGADALLALIIDLGWNPPGHRIHLLAMNAGFAAHREIGTGYATGDAPSGVPPPSTGQWNSGAYWTIHTAERNGADPVWLTGVVYNDGNGNGRYDQGEGLGGVLVSTTGAGVFSTTTNSAGGWSLAVSSGNFTVTCSGGGFSGTATADVVVATSNVAVDFASGEADGEINFGGSSSPRNPPPGNTDTDAQGSSGGGCAASGGQLPRGLGAAACLFAVLRLTRRRVHGNTT